MGTGESGKASEREMDGYIPLLASHEMSDLMTILLTFFSSLEPHFQPSLASPHSLRSFIPKYPKKCDPPSLSLAWGNHDWQEDGKSVVDFLSPGLFINNT